MDLCWYFNRLFPLSFILYLVLSYLLADLIPVCIGNCDLATSTVYLMHSVRGEKIIASITWASYKFMPQKEYKPRYNVLVFNLLTRTFGNTSAESYVFLMQLLWVWTQPLPWYSLHSGWGLKCKCECDLPWELHGILLVLEDCERKRTQASWKEQWGLTAQKRLQLS